MRSITHAKCVSVFSRLVSILSPDGSSTLSHAVYLDQGKSFRVFVVKVDSEYLSVLRMSRSFQLKFDLIPQKGNQSKLS